MALQNGEFAIDGFRFGCGHPHIGVSTLDATGIRWRVQDQPNPVGDNILAGRDFGDPQPITMELFFKGKEPEEVAQAAAEFANAWATPRHRLPGQDTALEIGIHGRTVRAYGRPRDLNIDDSEIFARRHATGTAVFDRTDGLFYGNPDEGGGGQVSLTIMPPQSAGLVFPIVFPWTTLTGGKRQGIVSNTGLRPTRDVTITINGPISQPIVTGSGWRVELDTTLEHDQSVTIDARAKSVLRNDGARLAGTLSRRSSLRDIQVPPGQSEFTFQGVDRSGSATATIRWASAHTSLGA